MIEEKMSLKLSQRLIAIMNDLHYIQKGSKMVNNQYRFVSHDQVSSAVHPLLVKHGVLVIPTVEESKQEGNRTEVKLLVSFANADNPEDSFHVRYFGYGIDSGDKGPGKAISYAYKYALLKVLCLETGDDPDQDASATYEPIKCLEFDAALPEDMSDKDKKKIGQFLEYSAEVTGKHVEDMKREAMNRLPQFLEAAKKWTGSKKGGKE